jgi:hypothetical protein
MDDKVTGRFASRSFPIAASTQLAVSFLHASHAVASHTGIPLFACQDWGTAFN